jgi:hypothetical protein
MLREWVARFKREQAISEKMGSDAGLVLSVPLDKFQAEPAFDVQGDQATGIKPGEDMEYREVRGPIFDGAPKSSDVSQGLLGDCPYLAVLVALPTTERGRRLLTDMVQETHSGYRVTFPTTDKQGAAVINLSKWFVVRPYIAKMRFAFARHEQDLEDKGTHLEINRPLWPMIIEKALAMHPAANEMQRRMTRLTGYGGLSFKNRSIPSLEARRSQGTRPEMICVNVGDSSRRVWHKTASLPLATRLWAGTGRLTRQTSARR